MEKEQAEKWVKLLVGTAYDVGLYVGREEGDSVYRKMAEASCEVMKGAIVNALCNTTERKE